MTSTQAKATTPPVRLAIRRGFILHDPALVGFEPNWFEPDWWSARDRCRKLGAGRGAAWRLDGEHGQWVLRHYRRGGLAARVSHDRYLWMGESRCRSVAEFTLLRELVGRGLPVPEPVAARVVRSGPWYHADLLMKYLPATRTMASLLESGKLHDDALAAIGRLVRRFHAEGVWHADLNAHNVLLDDTGVFLIDFDRARVRAPGTWQEANLARLRRSLNKLSGAVNGRDFSTQSWSVLEDAWQAGA